MCHVCSFGSAGALLHVVHLAHLVNGAYNGAVVRVKAEQFQVLLLRVGAAL